MDREGKEQERVPLTQEGGAVRVHHKAAHQAGYQRVEQRRDDGQRQVAHDFGGVVRL